MSVEKVKEDVKVAKEKENEKEIKKEYEIFIHNMFLEDAYHIGYSIYKE